MKTTKDTFTVSVSLWGGIMLSASLVAGTVDSPWARWKAEASAIADATHNEPKWTCADASGNGHFLLSGGQVFRAATAAGRTDTFRYNGWGPAWSTFEMPAMPSCTFAAWTRFPSGNLNHYAYSQCKLMYLVHDFSGLSVSFEKNSDFSLERTPITFTLALGDHSFTVTNGTGRLLVKKWNHVAVTMENVAAAGAQNRTVNLRLYVNGVCAFARDGLAVPSAAAALTCIGNANTESASKWGNSFIGYLDDMRVYDSALAASEVKSLYDATNDRPWLVGHWPMDRIDTDGSGNRTTPDVSGSGFDLKLGSLESLTDGLSGSALFFGGARNDAVDAPACDSYASFVNTNLDLSLGGEFTLAMWVRKASDQLTYDGGRLFAPVSGSPYLYLKCRDSAESTLAKLFTTYYRGSSADLSFDGLLLRANEWTHSTITCSYVAGDRTDAVPASAGYELKGYLNGVLKFKDFVSSVDKAVLEQYAFSLARSDGTQTEFIFGNSSEKNRPYRGAIDDLRFYGCALSADQVAALYCLPTGVSAGADFSVVGTSAELQGCVSTRTENGIAPGVTGDLAWSLVSAPGGVSAGVVFGNAAAAVTTVTLPATGTYVFRLTAVRNGVSASDEVTVTRVAAPAGTAPTVVCSAAPYARAAVVKAAVSETDCRVRWTKTSGPGAAWFVDDTAAETLVEFSASGTYELTATAANDAGTAVGTVTVTVGGTDLASAADVGLRAHWTMSSGTSAAGNAVRYDEIAGYTLTPAYGYPVSHWVPCVNGNYTWTVGDRPGLTRMITNYVMEQNAGVGTAPSNEWETVSVWMYHDGSCTSKVNYAAIMNCNVSHALMYMPEGGASTDFEVMQIPSGSGNVATMRCRFKGPDRNFTNRWVHVLMVFNCHATADSELWVDGVKLSPRTGYSARLEQMRRVDQKYMFGGSASALGPGYLADMTDLNRTFPGTLSDIRIYDRRLDEAEIRHLAAYPRGDENRAPDVALGTMSAKAVVGTPVAVSTQVIDDGRPSDGTLQSRWEVVSGDAGKLVIDDSDPDATVFTGLRGGQGVYGLRLVSTDGDRTVYSGILTLTMDPRGLMLLIR